VLDRGLYCIGELLVSWLFVGGLPLFFGFLVGLGSFFCLLGVCWCLLGAYLCIFGFLGAFLCFFVWASWGVPVYLGAPYAFLIKSSYLSKNNIYFCFVLSQSSTINLNGKMEFVFFFRNYIKSF
jgi:hypothetical protein